MVHVYLLHAGSMHNIYLLYMFSLQEGVGDLAPEQGKFCLGYMKITWLSIVCPVHSLSIL